MQRSWHPQFASTGNTQWYWKRTANTLTASLEPQWKELMTRPSRQLHENRSSDLFTFIRMQILGTTGGLPLENHMVYMMMASQKPYVGRTGAKICVSHTSSTGIAPRWSEHVRDLQGHINKTVPKDRQRLRYKMLQAHQPSGCLDIIILDTCTTENISAREAFAITRINPAANGHELWHFFTPPPACSAW